MYVCAFKWLWVIVLCNSKILVFANLNFFVYPCAINKSSMFSVCRVVRVSILKDVEETSFISLCVLNNFPSKVNFIESKIEICKLNICVS